MKEGWHNDDYLTVFDPPEVSRLNDAYGIRKYLEGYTAVGLRSWDDFILVDEKKRYFTVPTVPLAPEHLAEFIFPSDLGVLQHDERYAGKVKWYVTPIVFGGDPSSKENMAWISVEEHTPFVRWWNDTYRAAKAQKPNQAPDPTRSARGSS